MIVKGYACHFNKRNGNGEIVLPTSFDEVIAFYKKNKLDIPINYFHNEDQILGHIIDIKKDSVGLYITAELNDEVDLVKNFVKPLIKDGTFNRFSTEGTINKKDIEKLSDGTYIAKKFNITAVAIVPLPADVDAIFTYNGKKNADKTYMNAFTDRVSNNKAIYVV